MEILILGFFCLLIVLAVCFAFTAVFAMYKQSIERLTVMVKANTVEEAVSVLYDEVMEEEEEANEISLRDAAMNPDFAKNIFPQS